MTNPPKILAFAGSAREGSLNKILVKIAAEGAKTAGASVTYLDLRFTTFVHFCQGAAD